MASNTAAVLHVSVSTCCRNCIGPTVARQPWQCQLWPTLGQRWLGIWVGSWNMMVKIWWTARYLSLEGWISICVCVGHLYGDCWAEGTFYRCLVSLLQIVYSRPLRLSLWQGIVYCLKNVNDIPKTQVYSSSKDGALKQKIPSDDLSTFLRTFRVHFITPGNPVEEVTIIFL